MFKYTVALCALFMVTLPSDVQATTKLDSPLDSLVRTCCNGAIIAGFLGMFALILAHREDIFFWDNDERLITSIKRFKDHLFHDPCTFIGLALVTLPLPLLCTTLAYSDPEVFVEILRVYPLVFFVFALPVLDEFVRWQRHRHHDKLKTEKKKAVTEIEIENHLSKLTSIKKLSDLVATNLIANKEKKFVGI